MRRDRELRGRDACSRTGGAAEAHCGGLCPRREPLPFLSHDAHRRVLSESKSAEWPQTPFPISHNSLVARENRYCSRLRVRQAALLQPWPPAARRGGRRSRFARLRSLAKDGLIGLFITKSVTDSDFRIHGQTELVELRKMYCAIRFCLLTICPCCLIDRSGGCLIDRWMLD